MEPPKTPQKSFLTELVDHLIPVIKEFKNQENKPGESSKTDTSKKNNKIPGDNEEKSFIQELADHLIPVIKEFKNQENKPGESSKTDSGKKIDKIPEEPEDKEANFQHNRIADSL